MRVLVTGTTGFTGGHLARALQRRGDQVRALVREPSKARAVAEQGIALEAGDLADASALDRATRDIDVVYHIAALYREAGLPDETYRAINAVAARTLNLRDNKLLETLKPLAREIRLTEGAPTTVRLKPVMLPR